jgi:hypothetical protein
MNTKTYKQAFVVLSVGIFIVPQIALAAWWNPFTWNFFHLFNKPAKTEVVNVARSVATTTIATTTIATSTVDNNVIIKTEVEKQVKATLKAKADEGARIAQQKKDEQTKIDEAIKAALDKQQPQQPQIVTQTSQTSTTTAGKNYYMELKSRLTMLISIEKSFETWLQDTSDQFRSASLTLSGHYYGGSREATVKLANANISIISDMLTFNKKSITNYQNLLDAINNNPKGFIDELFFNSNKIRTPESLEIELAGIKKSINVSLGMVMEDLH